MNNLHAISLITQYGLVAQGLEHHTGVTGSWVQSPAGSLLLIHPCDRVWNLVNSYICYFSDLSIEPTSMSPIGKPVSDFETKSNSTPPDVIEISSDDGSDTESSTDQIMPHSGT